MSFTRLFSKTSFNAAEEKRKIKPKPQNLILYSLLLANPQGGTKEKSDKSKDHKQLLYQINLF